MRDFARDHVAFQLLATLSLFATLNGPANVLKADQPEKPPAVHAPAAARDAVRDALDEHDKQIQTAKKQFDAAWQRASDVTVKHLLAAGETAAKANNDDLAQRAYKEVLRIDRANAKARDYFSTKGNLDSLLTGLTLEWTPVILVTDSGWEKSVAYETLLGRYRDGGTYSVGVSLAIPDGTNTFNDDVRRRLAALQDATGGKVSWWEGRGFIAIPKDGSYKFKGPTRKVEIDGKEINEIGSKPVDVLLKQGKHAILISADSGYKSDVAISIVEPRTGTRIPIYNTLDDIKQFLRPATGGGKSGTGPGGKSGTGPILTKWAVSD